jgi:uncharacterized protein (TIGR03437 family)
MESMKTKTSLLVVLLLGACAWQCSAQAAFDSSGDGQLNGAYYMRQVFYFVSDQEGDLGDATNIQGEITFSGSGTYTFSGTLLDYASGAAAPTSFTATGTYVVSASGEGYISSVNPSYPSDHIIGLVSHSVFIGSSTENGNGYSDLFIAAPIGSVATNATLNGSYSVAYFDPTFPGDALFTMSANGSGSIGTVNVTGYVENNSTPSTETLTGVTYSFTNGGAQINFGGSSSNLIFGTEVLYITPDGNFVFGGSADGFDMFAGVRAATSNPSNYDGLYYQAGLDLDEALAASDDVQILDSYFGSLQAFSTNIIGHERDYSLVYYGGSSDFTYYDSYTLGGNGTSTDTEFGQEYVSSTDGTIRIGYGLGPFLGLNIAFQGPPLSGSGVYLSPVGVVNAASSSPFTAFISPGEFLTLYGSGLAPTTTSASVPFPKNLSGVTVTINQIQAPIYYVSPTQISVIVPYITSPASIAEIQVNNNGANSNIVTQFTGLTSAGVFTNNPVGGIGIAAALRPDNSVVSESNPAQVTDTIQLFLAGMGAVANQPADGTAAPSSTLSTTSATPAVYLYDSAGNIGTPAITYSGLAPGFAGLYQINFTIASGLVSGDAALEVQGPDSDTLEALLPYTTTASAAVPADRSGNPRPHVHHHLRSNQTGVGGKPRSIVNWRARVGG